jgi:pimeloyl-ACP methyl ester carboxylesterase
MSKYKDMVQTWIQRLKASQDATFLQGVHLLAKGFFKTRGYRWELRRNGEVKLGYWRKSLRPKDKRSVYPKRFVLIPGFGDSSLSWHMVLTFLVPILKLNFDEIILFDFPGFGGYLSHERSFATMDLMMTALNDTLDSLKPHTIMGHSLGAWLTAHYAADCGSGKRPLDNKKNYEGPDTILLASPSGIFSSQQMREEWEAIFRTAMTEGLPALRPHLFAKEPGWFRLIAPHFSQFLGREDIHAFMGSFREDHSVDRIAHQIKAKVWLLWGEKDTLIPSSCAGAWLHSLDPKQKNRHGAVIIREAGHSPHLESPAATAAVIAQILSGRNPHQLGKRWWNVLEEQTN